MVRVEIKKEYNRYSTKITLRTRIVLSVIFLSKYKMNIYSFVEKGIKGNNKNVENRIKM